MTEISCHVKDCKFNSDFCQRSIIEVNKVGVCVNFEHRPIRGGFPVD